MRRRPPGPEPEDQTPWDPEAPVQLPLDGELDLHLFAPKEVGALVTEYLAACRQEGVLQVRIAHGKGTGALRRGVHALLQRLVQQGEVERFAAAGEADGGWGATW
ncbi:MAG TPA: Smr/MutS family protein, partial [Aggregicoccus sp.]|nr:Smr/MutS family protein [Aggregicoccus sp.]